MRLCGTPSPPSLFPVLLLHETLFTSQMAQDPFLLSANGKTLALPPHHDVPARIMGILNVTPDSFYAASRVQSVSDALTRAKAFVSSGCTIIDVGGESTRPKGKAYGEGATPVDEAAERERVVPVIEAIRAELPEVWISIDTYKPGVAAAALEAGADIVNDVTAGRLFPAMFDVVADHDVPLVLMHSHGKPGDMPHTLLGAADLATVEKELMQQVDTALAHGCRQLILDPGFGFGKDVSGNLALIGATAQWQRFGWPLLTGVSRKSTIGAVLGETISADGADDRLAGSLALTALAIRGGSAIVRTHDGRPTAATAHMLHAMARYL